MAGKAELAIEKIETTIRLSPKDPFSHLFLFAMSLAHIAAEQYEEAIQWGKQSLQVNSRFPLSMLVLAGSYAMLDRLTEARATIEELLRLNPGFSLTGVEAIMSGWNPVLAGRCTDALRKAGLPE
jgi:tetratricopeptide (TPR) repeat protein